MNDPFGPELRSKSEAALQPIAIERMKAWLDKLQPQGVVLDEEQCKMMVRLDSMMLKWNRTAGLIGFRSDEERFDRYFGEALHGSMWLPKTGRVVDLGTGGGSPAIPMAIHRPELEWIFLEPNHKKALFLQEASTALGLTNIHVEKSRVPGFRPIAPVGIVTTRGLALSRGAVQAVRDWLEPAGRLLIFSGQRASERIVETCGGDWVLKGRERLAPRFQAVLVVLERA